MRIRKPGLWFKTMGVEFEDVTPGMSKCCASCAQPIKTRRMRVKKGSGRYSSSEVYCMNCAYVWINEFQETVARARLYVATGEGCIRNVKGVNSYVDHTSPLANPSPGDVLITQTSLHGMHTFCVQSREADRVCVCHRCLSDAFTVRAYTLDEWQSMELTSVMIAPERYSSE